MKTFCMTQDELEGLSQAARTPGVFLGGILQGYSPARSASDAIWRRLGDKYGFDWQTAKPVPGQPQHVFQAEPSSPEAKA